MIGVKHQGEGAAKLRSGKESDGMDKRHSASTEQVRDKKLLLEASETLDRLERFFKSQTAPSGKGDPVDLIVRLRQDLTAALSRDRRPSG